jgi:hypothetical protein
MELVEAEKEAEQSGGDVDKDFPSVWAKMGICKIWTWIKLKMTLQK